MFFPILVVDDNLEILSNIRDYLVLKGYNVETTPSGAEALERLNSRSYSLCVLDIGLPVIDGLSICQTLRKQHNNVPILMLTARDSIDDRVRGLEVGADDYLVKPFALRELTARIDALLRRTYGDNRNLLQVGDLVMNLQRRNPVFDIMRGIGILLVVLGHAGFPFSGWIYLFHMPLFLFVAGLFSVY